MAVLPQTLRRAVPDRLRDDVRLRAVAVGAGLIPPRTLHSAAERELLQSLARRAGRVVEIGVYEGASAAALCEAMRPDAELHLIDPFGHHPTALPAGWGAIERASPPPAPRAAGRGRDRGGPPPRRRAGGPAPRRPARRLARRAQRGHRPRLERGRRR